MPKEEITLDSGLMPAGTAGYSALPHNRREQTNQQTNMHTYVNITAWYNIIQYTPLTVLSKDDKTSWNMQFNFLFHVLLQ